MRSFRTAVRKVDACVFASRNASSSESGASEGEGEGTCACVATAQTSAISTARGIALGLESFSILSPRWAEYTQESINRRLIDHRKLMSGFKNVSFTATSVQQFVQMFSVDLFPQAVYVDFDNVRERIERVIPNMGRDLRARNELARTPSEVFE